MYWYQAGDWLCLKNLHLVVAWLPSLEKELSSLEPHADFRLWLTTEPHEQFPPLLLQQSLKVLLHIYFGVSPLFFEQGKSNYSTVAFSSRKKGPTTKNPSKI